jgi:hypothetical protein
LSPDMEARHIYESDRWFADTLVEIILQMEPEEEPARFWKPILDSGPPAHAWIEMFFSTWLVHGLHSTKQKRFIAEWQAIFAYALQSPIWSDRDKCWPHWDDVWLHLLGFDHWDITHMLLSDQVLLEDFRALVSLLARRQNALAMDLQERMGTPGTS